MNPSDYTGQETVGEMLDRLGHAFIGMLEGAKERFLNMPAEKLITILSLVALAAVVAFVSWGFDFIRMLIKEKREQRRLRQVERDDSNHQI